MHLFYNASEVARASSTELKQKINDMVTERDSTLQQAQEMSEQLDNAEKERDQLQIAFESSQNQVEELQFQLEEITSQHKILEQESNAESIVIQRRLETTEELLTERERELAEAREKVITLSDDLLASQGKVSLSELGAWTFYLFPLDPVPLMCIRLRVSFIKEGDC